MSVDHLKTINFLINNLDGVLLIIGSIFALFASYKHKSFEGIRQMLFAVITKAEEEYGPGMGLLKMADVASYVWEHIPGVLQLFVSQKDVENLIEKALQEAKGKWAQSEYLTEYVSHHNEDVVEIPVELKTKIAEAKPV